MGQHAPTSRSIESYDGAENTIPYQLKLAPLPKLLFGRETEILQLQKQLGPHTPSRHTTIVIRGDSGIGKTSLAGAYARKYHQGFSDVYFLDGSSKDRLQLSIFATIMLPPRPQMEHAPEVLKNPNSIEKLTQDFIKWLSSPSTPDWLLIIDNMERSLKELHPLSLADHGSVLITTSSKVLEGYEGYLDLGRVDPGQARAILESNAGRPIKEVELIIAQLDGNPLPLTLAGSYLRETGCDASCYVKILQSENLPQLEDAHSASWKTSAISCRRVTCEDKDTERLFSLWSVLDDRDLWVQQVPAIRNARTPPAVPRRLLRLVSNKGFSQALRLPMLYSLVEPREGIGCYSMLPIVHRWCQQSSRKDQKVMNWCFAASIVAAVACDGSDLESSISNKLLLPHARRVSKAFEDDLCKRFFGNPPVGSKNVLNPWFASALEEVNAVGGFLEQQGSPDEAETMHKLALLGFQTTRNDNDWSTLSTCFDLGTVHQKQGKLDEAEKMFQRALDGYKEKLDPGNADISATALRLISVYRDRCLPQQTSRESIREQLRALVDLDRLFGPLDSFIFGCAGRMLVWAGEEELALRAFDQQLDGSNQCDNVTCDGDDCSYIPGVATGRFICKRCADTDFCHACGLDEARRKVARAECKDHAFFDASPEQRSKAPPEGRNLEGRAREELLTSFVSF